MTDRTMLPWEPMRSLIFVDLAKEDYRIKLENWLYKHHISESISQFQPYVTKYAFYPALPVPQGGDRFGAVRMQMTEHYWLCNPNNPKFAHHKVLTEYFPTDVLIWQNNMPESAANMNFEGDDARATKGSADSGTVPFVFAFIPVWWEEDFKGAGRTIEDGPNYRWQCAIKYPEGHAEEGEKWLHEEFIPAFVDAEETNRIVSSRVIKDANGCDFDRIVEMWFDGPTAWGKAVEKASAKVAKPAFAETEDFPYLTKSYGFTSVFLSDIPRSDNMSGGAGGSYITMR